MQENRLPPALQRPKASSPHTLLQQPQHESQTTAGRYWTAGGQLHRDPQHPDSQAEPTKPAAVPSILSEPSLNSTARVTAQLQQLRMQQYDR